MCACVFMCVRMWNMFLCVHIRVMCVQHAHMYVHMRVCVHVCVCVCELAIAIKNYNNFLCWLDMRRVWAT